MDICPIATLTEYEISHLVAHLAAAGRHGAVGRLLAHELPAGRNFWFEQKDASGDAPAYVADVELALAHARAQVDEHVSAGRRCPGIGDEIRYALLIASSRGHVKNVPLPMLVALVQTGVWAPQKALANVRGLLSPIVRIDALARIAPHLPSPLIVGDLREALNAAKRLEESEWANAVERLAPLLPPALLDLALADAAEVDWGGWRASALRVLAPHLTERQMPKALDIAGGLDRAEDKAEALAALGAAVPDRLVSEVLRHARDIAEPAWRAVAVAGLGPRLGARGTDEAIAAVASSDDDEARAAALSRLAPDLPPGLMTQALAAANAITDDNSRGRALEALAPRLPADLLPLAMEAAGRLERDDRRSDVLVAMAPSLPPERLDEALAIARNLEDEKARARALAGLARTVAPPAHDDLLRKAFRAAERIPFGIGGSDFAARAIVRLARTVARPARDDLLREAFLAAERIPFGIGGSDFAAELIGELPEDVLPRALKLARSVPADSRVEVLVAVGRRLTEPMRGEVLHEALLATRRVTDEYRLRADAIGRVAALLPGDTLSEVLGDAGDQDEQSSLKERISAVVPFLDADELRRALRSARELRDGQAASRAVATFARRLPPPRATALFSQALEQIAGIREPWDRAMALAEVAPLLPDEHMNDGWAIAEAIGLGEPRGRAIAELAPFLPEPIAVRAAASARGIPYDHYKAQALAGLATRVGDPAGTELAAEALRTVPQIDDESWRWVAPIMSRLSPKLVDELVPDALAVARRIFDPETRSTVLEALAPRVAPQARTSVLREVLSAVREIAHEDSRASALARLAEQLPEALEHADELSDPRWRARARAPGTAIPLDVVRDVLHTDGASRRDLQAGLALANLIPYLPPDQFGQALAAIASVVDDWARSRAIVAIAPLLPAELVADALGVTATIVVGQRAPPLAALADAHPVQLRECWRQAREILDDSVRPDALKALTDLVLLIDRLGGPHGCELAVRAIDDVTRWLP